MRSTAAAHPTLYGGVFRGLVHGSGPGVGSYANDAALWQSCPPCSPRAFPGTNDVGVHKLACRNGGGHASDRGWARTRTPTPPLGPFGTGSGPTDVHIRLLSGRRARANIRSVSHRP